MQRYAPIAAAFLFGAVLSYIAVRIVGIDFDRRPVAALIVEMKTPVNQELSARYISDPSTLSALEEFFPHYQSRPTSTRASGWTTSYYVYFSFAGGDTVLVAVSFREAAQWSTGQGDFPVHGRFFDFVDELFNGGISQ